MTDWYSTLLGIEDLNASYLRLREAGIEPAMCIDHGMTFSYYLASRLSLASRSPSTSRARPPRRGERRGGSGS